MIRNLLKNEKQIVCIDIDSVRSMFSNMDWDNGYQEYVNAIKLTVSMVDKLISLGYSRSVVADTFRLDQLCEFISELNYPYSICSLFCDKDVLIARIMKRNLPCVSINDIVEYNEKIRGRDLPISMQKKGIVKYIDVSYEVPKNII